MIDLVIPAPPACTAAVAGSIAKGPVRRVYCIGRNCRWSADEARPVDMPSWFMKPADAMVPAQGVMPTPSGTSNFCHEVERVVAIGRGGRDIEPAQAVSPLRGFAVGLDLTRRDLQQQARRAGGPWEPAASCGHPRRSVVG